MKEVAGALLFFGIGSIVLNFVGYEFMLLSWIDNWGTTVGWGIKGAMIVIGGILYVVSMKSGGDTTHTADTERV